MQGLNTAEWPWLGILRKVWSSQGPEICSDFHLQHDVPHLSMDALPCLVSMSPPSLYWFAHSPTLFFRHPLNKMPATGLCTKGQRHRTAFQHKV